MQELSVERDAEGRLVLCIVTRADHFSAPILQVYENAKEERTGGIPRYNIISVNKETDANKGLDVIRITTGETSYTEGIAQHFLLPLYAYADKSEGVISANTRQSVTRALRGEVAEQASALAKGQQAGAGKIPYNPPSATRVPFKQFLTEIFAPGPKPEAGDEVSITLSEASMPFKTLTYNRQTGGVILDLDSAALTRGKQATKENRDGVASFLRRLSSIVPHDTIVCSKKNRGLSQIVIAFDKLLPSPEAQRETPSAGAATPENTARYAIDEPKVREFFGMLQEDVDSPYISHDDMRAFKTMLMPTDIPAFLERRKARGDFGQKPKSPGRS